VRYSSTKVVQLTTSADKLLVGSNPKRTRIRFTVGQPTSNDTALVLLGNGVLQSAIDQTNGVSYIGCANDANQAVPVVPLIFDSDVDGDCVTKEWHAWAFVGAGSILSITVHEVMEE